MYPILVQQSLKEVLSPCSATMIARGGILRALARMLKSPVRQILAPVSMRPTPVEVYHQPTVVLDAKNLRACDNTNDRG